jgi:hypothetical protein
VFHREHFDLESLKDFHVLRILEYEVFMYVYVCMCVCMCVCMHVFVIMFVRFARA